MKQQLIIFPRGQLTTKDKRAMAKLGVCAIEADDPSKVVTVVPGMAVTGDMLSMAAMDAMADGTWSADYRAKFAANLHKAIKAKQELANVQSEPRSQQNNP